MFAPSSRVAATLVALSLFAGGCANPGQPAKQVVRVETTGCDSVSCELSNDRGTWLVPHTPGSVTLTTSQVPLRVLCRADEASEGGAAVPSELLPGTGAGAVAGGAAGGVDAGAAAGTAALAFIPVLGVMTVLTGIGVGAAAGAAVDSAQRKLHYPELIRISMICPGPSATLVSGMRLGLSIRGLTAAQAREAGLGERSAVLVTEVAEGGLAAAAGLRIGDIVLAAGGHDLGDAAALEELAQRLPTGVPLSLRVWRAGQILDFLLTRPQGVP